MAAEVGKTKDAGYQVGARKTFDVDQGTAWNFMFSAAGLRIWLNGAMPDSIEVGNEFVLTDGTKTRVTVFKPSSHIRLNLSKNDWESHSRLQLRVIDSKGKSVIAFHHELLEDSDKRAEMRIHWKVVLESISESLS